MVNNSFLDPSRFREVLGHYPTGVVVIAAQDPAGEPVGMTIGSFTSVSLDPPLVGFLPSKTSSSWAQLKNAGRRLSVNVLSSSQREICRAIANRKTHKFQGIPWHLSDSGNPVLDEAVAHIDCTITVVHDAGDHEFVVASVDELQAYEANTPLLFHRGAYGVFAPLGQSA